MSYQQEIVGGGTNFLARPIHGDYTICVHGGSINSISVWPGAAAPAAGSMRPTGCYNNNNNPRTIFIVLSSWPLKVIARVHWVHLMNAAQRTRGCQPSDQATWLGL